MSAQSIAGNGSKWIRPEKRQRIYDRDGRCCVWCGSASRLSLDHCRPYGRGGSNRPRNLITACLSCNSARCDRSMAAFARVVAERLGCAANVVLARVRAARRRVLPRSSAEQSRRAA